MRTLVEIAHELARDIGALPFEAPVAYVYNPLAYAWRPHEMYLQKYGVGPRARLFLGMNPGPFGMAQTGVPFGEVAMVRDWLGIQAPVDRPPHQHPNRPVLGFDCPRSEVSGRRLWGWIQHRFGTPERFFAGNFVHNYCPLLFLDESGRNLTPDKLRSAACERLYAICDRALRESVETLGAETVVGIGNFAEKRARTALRGASVRIVCIPHPSPASPAANRGWAEQAEASLAQADVVL